MPPGLANFADRLAESIDRCGSPVCVGLDPVLEKLPDAAPEGSLPIQRIARYALDAIKAVAPHVAAIKVQSACFERFGAAGIAALQACLAVARDLGLIAILDAKRGDIGVTAEHYAATAFGPPGESVPYAADALTVSPYLGPDTLEPYLKHQGRGIFVLVRTSNPGSDAIQSQRLADGRTVAELVADHVAALGKAHRGASGLSSVGAVVGATKAADAAALRARMPDQVFLVPGYGAQGGTADDIRTMLRPGSKTPGTGGVLVTASRSVIYAFKPGDPNWQQAVAAAAKRFASEIRDIIKPA